MFKLIFTPKAQDFLNSLDKEEFNFLTEKLDQFEEDPTRFKIKKLKGTPYYRVRFDDFRVIYTKDGRIIAIIEIGRRDKIYRRLK